MSGPSRLALLRSLATIGMAVAAPVALLSGIFVFMTLWRGVPRFLMAVFVFAVSATALATLLYVAVDIQEREAGGGGDG